jgi:hypothetical protein
LTGVWFRKALGIERKKTWVRSGGLRTWFHQYEVCFWIGGKIVETDFRIQLGCAFLWLAGAEGTLAIWCREVYQHLGSGVTYDDCITVIMIIMIMLTALGSCWENKVFRGSVGCRKSVVIGLWWVLGDEAVPRNQL